ncbi:chorismate synthase [Varibaculum cambriense]|uniref:chorismate synthase n=1 Tax=Varibaculum cambriense TaxID=184870 RepID=UPI0029030691|nr:chorismate synthase [Varibaculum cambriense]MDU1224164.1 chorismate synthase [Varibaculum cambriense]
MLRWMSAGESHGPALVGILEGMPAGIEITTAKVGEYLASRRAGYGRGARQKFEQDRAHLVGGVIRGKTTGAPIALLIENSEWPKWETVMSPDPVDPQALKVDAGKGDQREVARNKPLTRPRPGHADLAGMLAYDLEEARPVLERASARETAMRVGLGAFAQEFLKQSAGIELISYVTQIGQARLEDSHPIPALSEQQKLAENPVRCPDKNISEQMISQIDAAKKNGDTIGGSVEVAAYGMPLGLGSHVSADRRLDARLAAALMSIPAVKTVKVGDGTQPYLPGSEAHDEIVRAENGDITRASNHAGGIEGGMSNGQLLRVSCAFKPISTVPRALRSIDLANGEESRAIHQRSDTCAVVPGAVIAQAQVALVLADALLEHIGGYSLAQVRENLQAYQERVEARL